MQEPGVESTAAPRGSGEGQAKRKPRTCTHITTTTHHSHCFFPLLVWGLRMWCGLLARKKKESPVGLPGEPLAHRTTKCLSELSPPMSPPTEACAATASGHRGQQGAVTGHDTSSRTSAHGNTFQRASPREPLSGSSQDVSSSCHHSRQNSHHGAHASRDPAGATVILRTIGLRPVLPLGTYPSTALDLDQLLHDLRYSLHPNAMSVMSLADPDDPPPLPPHHHGSTHSATISVNQAFELLVGAAGLAACGAADSYIERLLTTHHEARNFFCQKVALALNGPQAGAAASPDSPSIDIEIVVEGQMSSLTLTVLPFTASRTTLPHPTPHTHGAITARDLTITPAAADVFPALFVELRAELALQLAVQRSSVCMVACKDPVTMLTMDGQHILWQNCASQVGWCVLAVCADPAV